MIDDHSLVPFLFYLPVWLFMITLNWAGYKLMAFIADKFSSRIVTGNSFVKELSFWIFLSIIASVIFCFVITNYGAQQKRYDFIRLIFVTCNNIILFFTFWFYNLNKDTKVISFVKYDSKIRNRNIILFVLFNLIGNLVNNTPLFSNQTDNFSNNIMVFERYSSMISLVTTFILSVCLFLFRQKKYKIPGTLKLHG
jgi:hypothetical protein